MSRHDKLTPDAPDARRVELRSKAPEVVEIPTATPAEAKQGGGRKRAVLMGVAVVALVAGGYFGYQYWTQGRFMVETDDAYLQADITEISPRIQGYVSEAPVAENAHVKKGDVILKLDDGDYRNALATAQSRVATMDDTLARIDAQIMAAQAAVEQAKAGLQGAQAALTNAERTSERTQQLAKGNVVSQATLDSAAEGLETARANVTAAEAAIASAEANVSVLRAQRAEAAGQKRELELAAQQAERDLDKTVLRAPADGILANTAFEIGDLVSPGARLAALVPDNGIYIEANYKETELSGIAVGTEADVTIDAIPDRTFHGVVTSTAPATGSIFSLLPAENATGNFTKVVQRVPVRISLTDADGAAAQLRAGLSAVVDLDTRTTPGAGAGE